MNVNHPEPSCMLHDELQFAEESMPQDPAPGGWKIMIVDDDEFVHKVMELTLGDYRFENHPIEYLHAYSAAQAKTLLGKHPDTAVILLDVVMETETAGLQFARYVRNELGNTFVRIILRTGQPGQAPERKVITEYDINDYKHKAELVEQRLFTSITAAIRSYRDLRTIEHGRLGLQGIIQSSAALFGITSLPEFLAQSLNNILGVRHGASGDGLVVVRALNICTLREKRGQFACSPAVLEEMLSWVNDGGINLGIAVSEHVFQAGFLNTHSEEEYYFLVRFADPLSELEQNLLRALGNNIAVALNNLFLNEEIIATQREVVLTLGEVVETRSKETAQHVKRVAESSYLLALKAGLPEDRAQLLRMASPMHDVGKIGIPDSILFKPGRLTDEEYLIIKSHTIIGHAILKNSSRRILRTAATIALQHHEHWDGRGYPHGLFEDETHIFGRITALADVFDALFCERSYKKAWPLEDVVAYIREKRGKQFDPELAGIFLDNIEDFVAIRAMYPD